MAKKQTTSIRQVARNKTNYQYPRMPKTDSLLEEIRDDVLYKAHIDKRDARARKIINEHGIPVGPGKLIAGNLYMLEYFYPKTEEQLDYYDAMPCSIIFGSFKTKKGEPRVLAFSIHFFPPRISFQVMNKVMEIYQNIYKDSWKKGLSKELSYFQYSQLLYLLKKAKLEFAVHEYIPKLIGDAVLVPPSLWHIAVFTEGRFKKATREAILRYWKNFNPK